MYPPHLFNSAFRATEGWRENASLTRRHPPPPSSVCWAAHFSRLIFQGFFHFLVLHLFFLFLLCFCLIYLWMQVRHIFADAMYNLRAWSSRTGISCRGKLELRYGSMEHKVILVAIESCMNLSVPDLQLLPLY